MSTMIFREDEIIQLSQVDAELINKALDVSKSLGITVIKNSIANYKSIIQSNKGKSSSHILI